MSRADRGERARAAADSGPQRTDPEPAAADGEGPKAASRIPGIPGPQGSRYAWFVGVVALLILAYITLNTISTNPHGSRGVAVGKRVPPFAAPLATGTLVGDVDTALRAGVGAKRAACSLRGPQILNICQLYGRGPVVLVLFVDGGGCQRVLDDLARLAPAHPGVQIAAVALRPDIKALRALIRSHRLTFPVAYDRDGALFNLYDVASCPQLSFIYPGGVVAAPALLHRPALAQLDADIGALAAGSRARG